METRSSLNGTANSRKFRERQKSGKCGPSEKVVLFSGEFSSRDGPFHLISSCIIFPEILENAQKILGRGCHPPLPAALNNASGQRREMRAIARKKLEPTGGLFKNGLNLNSTAAKRSAHE